VVSPQYTGWRALPQRAGTGAGDSAGQYTGYVAEFHVEHFGCRAARADGEAVSNHLRAAGLGDGDAAAAEVVVVNTCSVTAEADRAARAFIRRTHRRNPKAQIVVTGCYAQRAPEELATMAGVAAVVGNSHKALAPEIVLELAGANARSGLTASELVTLRPSSASAEGAVPIWADDAFAHSFIEEPQLVPGTQTRPNLKIQEGCGNRCTFCVIPQTRGGSRSLSATAIMRQVIGFVEAGGIELVLSGINLGRWGRDLPSADDGPRTLAALVRRIVESSGLPRLRLSSIEPMDWDAELIALMAELGGPGIPPRDARAGRLARHAHLPLQSGSDAVLRRMHRRYRPWHYVEKVEALFKAAGPDLTLGADVMVGFPGETDAEFEETLEFVRALPFGYLHLFPFSPRPGTKGWTLYEEQPVEAQATEERMSALRKLADEKSREHRTQFVGRELECISLHTPDGLAAQNRTSALTDNFIPLEIEGRFAANQLLIARVAGMKDDCTLLADAAETAEFERVFADTASK
jgi:threonylcarbamoyladenosine tRNA methylthiotransferase MtaB